MGVAGNLKMLLGIIINIFGWLIFLIGLPPSFLFLFVPIRLYKFFVVLWARLFRPDLISLLTTYDTIFAIDSHQKRAYAANVTFIIVQGHLDIETVQSRFSRNVLSKVNENGDKVYDRLFQQHKSFGGYFFWSDNPDLDLNKQVKLGHEFENGDHVLELNTILGELMTSPMLGGLWEVILYKGFEGDKSVLVLRVHHTLGDGYTVNHMVDDMIEQTSYYMVNIDPRSCTDKLKLMASTPMKLVGLCCKGYVTRDNVFAQRKKSETGVVSITTLPLDTMKGIRRKSKTHFASVGMSLLGGALRRYFIDQNRPLPKFISIMHSLPRKGHPLGSMCNHWGVGLFKIPLDTPSALERLEQTEVSFDEYMSDQYNLFIQSQVPLLSLLPHFAVKLFFSTNFGAATGFTSLPAYDKEAHLWGHKVINMYKIFGFQWHTTAIAAAVYTHNGQVGYTILANRDIIPDQVGVDRVTREYLHAEMHQLVNEMGLDASI